MLDRTQEILLQMMKEIDTLCRENGIHYSLGGGTAIGAIRHKGFIPWDDDIDLYMTRDNWEKFINVYKQMKFPNNRVLESCEFDPEYSNTFGRYVATDNAAVHPHQIDRDDPAGYVIDIFVFDPIMKEDMNKFLKTYMLECDLINETMGFSTRFDINIDRYPKYLKRKSKEGLVAVANELTQEIIALGKDGHDSYAMEWGSAPMLMAASIFDNGYTRIPFENIEVETVKSFSEYLTFQFGDEWIYMPWHEEIEGHEAIYSEKISYDVIRQDFRSCIDMTSLRKAYISRKIKLLKANPARHKLADNECKRMGIKARLELEGIIQNQGVDIKAQYEAGDFWELDRVFSRYYEVQMLPEMIGRLDRHSKQYRYFNPVSIILEDEIMRIAIETLLRTERMSKAARLLEVYRKCGGDGPLTLALEEEINATRQLINRYSLIRKAQIGKLLEDVEVFLHKYTRNSQIMRLKIRLFFDTLAYREIEKSAVIIEKTVAYLKEVFPIGTRAHGEIFKYEGDAALLIHGDAERAKTLYEYAYKHTTNGIVRNEIQTVAGELSLAIDEADETPWIELKNTEVYTAEVSEEQVMAKLKEEDISRIELFRLKVNRRYYNRIIKKDDEAKQRALDVFSRTGDRVRLLDLYEEKLNALQKLKDNGEMNKLAQELEPHRDAVERNLACGLGLMVHPILSELQYEVYRSEGKGELAEQIDRLVPMQHRKPIGEK